MLKFGVKCGLWQEPTEVMVRVDISCLVLLKVTGPFWGGGPCTSQVSGTKI